MGMACWGPWEPRGVCSQRGGRCLTLVPQGSAEGASTLSPGGSGAPWPSLTCIFSIISNRSVFCNRDGRARSVPREGRLIPSSLGQALTTPACLVLSGGTKRVQPRLRGRGFAQLTLQSLASCLVRRAQSPGPGSLADAPTRFAFWKEEAVVSLGEEIIFLFASAMISVLGLAYGPPRAHQTQP